MSERRVSVLYFAVLRERRGCEVEQVAIAPGATAAGLYAALFPPQPAGVLPVLFAVNRSYVSGDHALEDGDEVAFIPPLGGG